MSGAPHGLSREISLPKAQNRLRYSDLYAVKARDFFGETLPRTFVTGRLISSYCFRRDKYVERKIGSAFSQRHQQLGSTAHRILFPKIFCG